MKTSLPGEEIEDADNDDDDPVGGERPPPPTDDVVEANELFRCPPNLHSLLDDDVNRDVITPNDDVSQPASEEERESAVPQGRSPSPTAASSATSTPSNTNSIPNHKPTRGAAARQRELMKTLVQEDLI